MTAAIATTYVNPYWDAVAAAVSDSRSPLYPGRVVRWYPLGDEHTTADRVANVDRFAWTVSDPNTVAFVVEHAGPRVLDPMAGTGYWSWLLRQHDIDVAAFDVAPPRGDGNNSYHRTAATYTEVLAGDAVDVTARHGADRTLLLSWPPYDDAVGEKVLAAFAGNRVIYIGETEGGCCGDDALFDRFARDWVAVATRMPVQWDGIRDFVTVYERRPGVVS